MWTARFRRIFWKIQGRHIQPGHYLFLEGEKRQMDSIQQFGKRLNNRYLIIGLAAWWLIMLIIYSVITLRINHHKGKLRETGVEITNEFSKLVSLPLLERNTQSMLPVRPMSFTLLSLIIAIKSSPLPEPDISCRMWLKRPALSIKYQCGRAALPATPEFSILYLKLPMPTPKLEKFSSACLPPDRFRPKNNLQL